MLTASPATWTVRAATFVLWALAAGSVVLWGLQLAAPSGSLQVPVAPARAVAPADPVAIARVLGASTGVAAVAVAQPALASRLQLVGVAAGASSGGGAAVISVDGKPARPYRVGAAIEEGLVLLSVRGRQATLGAQAGGPALLTLELPAFKKP